MCAAKICAATDVTTSKSYVIDQNVVTSVVPKQATNTPLGCLDNDKEDDIYCHTFWKSLDSPKLTKTFGKRSFKLTFPGERFLQEFYISWTALPILGMDYLKRNEIVLYIVDGILTWKLPVGAAEFPFYLDPIS